MAINFSSNGVNSLLNNNSKGMKIRHIPFEDLVPNTNNDFEITQIESLAVSIEDVGLRQPLEVKELADNKYMIVGGERRYTAIKSLIEKGIDKYEEIPCIVVDIKAIDLPISDEAKELYALTTTNAEQREFTDHDLMVMVRNLKTVYTEMKANGVELQGRQRDMIAGELQISSRQVQRYEYIDKNLNAEFKQDFKDDKIPLTVAVEVAHLTQDEQSEFKKEVEEKNQITKKDVENFVEKKGKLSRAKELDNELIHNEYIKDNNEFKEIYNQLKDIYNQTKDPVVFDKAQYKTIILEVEKIAKSLDKIDKTLEAQKS